MIKICDDDEFLSVVKEVTSADNYKYLTQNIQHADVTVARHCLMVASCVYKVAKYLKMKTDYHNLIRASLLHDYFFYDWHDKNKGFRGHGFKHPAFALENAEKDFDLSDREKDMIKKHMFPLTLFSIPKYKESWLLSLCDKYVATMEVLRLYK